MPSNKLKNLRKHAAQRQGGRCFYCELPMWVDSPRKFIVHYGLSPGLARRFQCTAEHVEARCDGGKDVAANIVAACLFCNATRHKAKHPVDAARHASVVRSRLAKGRWHPPQVKAAFSKQRMPPV
ncbi:HNH endonuclease [Agrobacterium tumefaciens]|uniref:HNH endonuclease n=1 Tax=Agrobacterium tumefaciens TaxID=358 RepID=UPI0021D0A82B|nr:HNH endonuclease [Agrobacterium tumefaciens]UXS11593.1 restriction endonuclease [Agrobacterium tumefaciens]UXS18959.1 restriction endonuclease [Agrobacterium tumefaciens]